MSHHVSKFYNYDPGKERDRLDHPFSGLELVTTCDLIDRHFPKEGSVCDIGCGPGGYSIELLKRGFSVSMLDLSEELLQVASSRLEALDLPVPADVICGNACDLSMFADGQFDAALCLGPMYHLIDRSKRQKALAELRRILKPGGVGIVSYINSWGVLRYGISRLPKQYEDFDFMQSLQGEVANPVQFDDFTECFWSTPPSATTELVEAGFEVVTYIGCESFASGQKDSVVALAKSHPKAYQNLVQMVRQTCELEQYRSSAEHIHFLVRAA